LNRKRSATRNKDVFEGYDLLTLPRTQYNKKKSPKTVTETTKSVFNVSIPYFLKKTSNIDFNEDFILGYLTDSYEGQQMLEKGVKLQAEKKKSKSNYINSYISNILSKSLKYGELCRFPKLYHLMGIDSAMITPNQWKEYRNANSSIVAVGPEQGRRYCSYINRYAITKMGIEIEYCAEYVRIKNPNIILEIMIRAINENKNQTISSYRVKQALWWQ